MSRRESRSALHKSFRARIAAVLMVAVAGCSSGDGPADPGPLPAKFGSLAIAISGYPATATPSVVVTGPGNYVRTVNATATITGLSAGNYTITVAEITHEGSTWVGSPTTQSVDVAAGASVVASEVFYLLTTGGLSVTLTGLPNATPAPVVITGPDGFSRTVAEPTSIVGLKPGAYNVEATTVRLTSATYAPVPSTQQIQVTASLTPSLANVTYALASGAMAISITGLPVGANGAVTVTGPSGFSATVTTTTTLENLTPGLYTIAASNVTSGALFIPTPANQQVDIRASAQPLSVSVSYTSAGTSLTVQVLGLPTGVPGVVSVNGPNGYQTNVTATQVLTGIPAGSYTIVASPITVACGSVVPTPATQTVVLPPGQALSATVTYSTAGAGLNLCIDGAYITQAVQSYVNDVPLIAGRNGLLRVFVRASGANSALPSVRARFYNGATLVSTLTIPPPLQSVPSTVDEATLGSSWNVNIAGTLLQPGLRMLVDVDPSNQVTETSEADNTLPANGNPGALDVRAVATLNVRLVPVIQTVRGDTARVTEANKANFILPMQRMFPVSTVDAQLREPYSYNGAELQSGGTNWITLLSEINALRVTEATGRMYYGLVRVGYNSGVAGLGYIGVPAAIGWDHQPSGTEVMAHELGHNFGRLHAPCGNPAGVDGSFPYSGATIGMFGYDIFAGTLKSAGTRDLMSYCDPPWISDYTYKAILNFRTSNPMVAAATSASTQRGLLVWGRIERGRLVLEPGFEVDAPASLPTRSGSHRLEGFGPAGETLFSLAFAGDRVADSPDPNDETFAFVIPLSQLRGVDLDRLRLSAGGRQAEQRGSGGGAIPSAQRLTSGRVRVSWDQSAARVALVRDARTGSILSFARGGVVDLQTASDDLEITLSNGVRSVRTRIQPK